MTTSSKQERIAFTLVELLVVISIIALLVALTLPAMGKARQKARAIGCAANLRQLGVALSQYGNDNGGSLPILGQWGTPAGVVGYGMSDWYRIAIGYLLPPDKLAGPVHSSDYPYYDNERNPHDIGMKLRMFSCPTIDRNSGKNYWGPTAGAPYGLWIGGGYNVFNYGFNNVGGVAGTGIDASTTKRLEQVVNNKIVIMDRDGNCNMSTTQTGTGQGSDANTCIPAGMGAYYWISWFTASYPTAGASTAGTMHESTMPGTGETMGGANILFSGLNVRICVPAKLYYPSWPGSDFSPTFSGTFTDIISD